MKNFVSVIFTSYNHERYLAQAVDSLLNQTYDKLEIIIIDDYSTDGSRKLLEKYRAYDQVKLVFLEKNTGAQASVCNLGVSMSKGDFILFAQSDDFSEPTKIEALVDKFINNDSVGVVYCRSNLVDENGTIIGDDFQFREKKFKRLCSQDTFISRRQMIRFLSSCNVIPNFSAVLIKRKYYDLVQGLTIKYKVCADWDFWFRLAEHCDFYYVASPLNNFRQHRGTIRNSIKMEEQVAETLEILNNAFARNKFSFIEQVKFKVNLSYIEALSPKRNANRRKVSFWVYRAIGTLRRLGVEIIKKCRKQL